jgi:hypothetical protein
MPRISTSAHPLVLSLLATLFLSLLVTVSPAVADSPQAVAAAKADRGDKARKTSSFRIATLNLSHELGPKSVRHDVRKVIATRRPTVIGFQERRDTKRELLAALPDHWALRMPTSADGTDDNPIAYDKRVWRAKKSFPRLLAKHTWRRNSGQTAINQYAVVVVLEHKRTGHLIRAISFHMPNLIHDRATGGPNWREPGRLGAFWRMAANVREVGKATPRKQQFVALCDCNVTESRDDTRQLVKGQITRPLHLENNYSAAGYRPGWRIDYVMAERHSKFRIVNWSVMHDLRTDHPAVITRFQKQR